MPSLQRKLLPLFVKFRIFPNVLFIKNPHKIFEFKHLQNQAKLQKSDVVLDVGCGIGFQTLLIGKKCKKIIGVDVSKEAIELATFLSATCSGRINSEFLCSTLESAKFPNDYFDKVFSICVIEHISNYKEMLAEIYRVLKPSGSFVFSADALTPIKSPELISKHKKDHSVENYFTVQQLADLLLSIGFRNVSVFPILKSNYAAKIFSQGIRDGFKAKPSFLLSYIKLVVSEAFTKNEDGILICANCLK